jgi:predicted amidohydrolase YtcJ
VTESDLFVGGRVFTGLSYAEALLVEDGEVLVAGTEREARQVAAVGTRIHSLAGGMVLPGLIDAHFHVAEVTRVREGLDLSSVRSLDELAATLARWASDHPGVVVGRGWDPERSAHRTWPNRTDLDRAVPDRPTVVVHASGHAIVVSSQVLATAGFGRSTEDPPGGRFGREADGTPDGRVYETAVGLLESRVRFRDVPDAAALRRTLDWATGFGLTTIGAMNASPEEALALRELGATGRLPGRVRVYLRHRGWEEYFRASKGPGAPPSRFAVLGVKEFTDGAFGPRTAWLSEPYADDPTTSGITATEEETLRPLFEAIAKRGLVPALHAIGDRAIAYALGMLDIFPRKPGPSPRIEHAALTPPDLVEMLARARPVLVVQPGFNWSDHWLTARLGPDRVRWAYAFRTLASRGLALVGSSDAPYDPVDPWRGLLAAVRRTDPEGRSANPTPEEALSGEEAVAMYTANAGTAFGEPNLGILEPGSPADLVVVDRPDLSRAIATGRGAVRETWVAGRLVARSSRSAPA